VLKTFTTDKKIKEASLAHAVSVLTAGESAPMGKDVVGEVFLKAIKSYRESYAKLGPNDDEILQQVEKDVAAVVLLSQYDGKKEAGNVYESHNIPGLTKL